MFKNYLADISFSVSLDLDKKRKKARLAENFMLGEIGIEELVLRLNQEHLHRVFNRRSFKLGGRAYGALHQQLPSEFRPLLRINHESTVELDYSGLHIRMLYHQKGIDYRQDPYLVCEGPSMQDIYKVVSLVAINARNENTAIGAIKEKLEEQIEEQKLILPAGITNKQEIQRMIVQFKNSHPDISEHLFSDSGIKLMNTDSMIMNDILMTLMNRGILGLPVFDSVIVAERHEDILKEVMIEVYERALQFKPIIKRNRKSARPLQVGCQSNTAYRPRCFTG